MFTILSIWNIHPMAAIGCFFWVVGGVAGKAWCYAASKSCHGTKSLSWRAATWENGRRDGWTVGWASMLKLASLGWKHRGELTGFNVWGLVFFLWNWGWGGWGLGVIGGWSFLVLSPVTSDKKGCLMWIIGQCENPGKPRWKELFVFGI